LISSGLVSIIEKWSIMMGASAHPMVERRSQKVADELVSALCWSPRADNQTARTRERKKKQRRADEGASVRMALNPQ
jgi:hypothetical protein